MCVLRDCRTVCWMKEGWINDTPALFSSRLFCLFILLSSCVRPCTSHTRTVLRGLLFFLRRYGIFFWGRWCKQSPYIIRFGNTKDVERKWEKKKCTMSDVDLASFLPAARHDVVPLALASLSYTSIIYLLLLLSSSHCDPNPTATTTQQHDVNTK